MKIIATQVFLRGRVRLAPGDGYELSDQHGWQLIGFNAARLAAPDENVTYILLTDAELGSDAPAPAAENVTLTVQDVSIGVNSPKLEL